MSVSELKEMIISKVAEINDEALLEECWSIINPEGNSYPEFDKDDFKELDKRIEDAEKGNYYQHKEFLTLVKDRLERYRNG